MTKFYVWRPDHGETVDDAKWVNETTARDAAQTFAEHHAGFAGDPFDQLEVAVQQCGDDLVRMFEINVEAVPYFRAHEVKYVLP